MAYRECWALQQRFFELRSAKRCGDLLLLVEHPPTVTLGRKGARSNLLLSQERYVSRGIEVVEIDRGGDVTFHGPGQLVGYPILDLAELLPDLHGYVRALEDVMIRVADSYEVAAARLQGLSGAWVSQDGAVEKLGAIGVKVKNWITMHGFALNVNTELEGFATIVPCGIQGKGVTSLARLLGRRLDMAEARRRTLASFCEVFGMRSRQAPGVAELLSACDWPAGAPPEEARPALSPGGGLR
ncbi:MAG: lipoyl(octanoyl) transferase LipB [Candidatus Wallbacteria bacterium]|nr:lipoyl(octanoyl) transferase LipB [Candidatus Wallbacteria bacterium]